MILDSYIYVALALCVTMYHFQYVNGLSRQMIFGHSMSSTLEGTGTSTHSLVSVNKLMDFTSCVRLCKGYSHCQAINYRVRMKLCQLTLYKGYKNNIVFRDYVNPGFIMWQRGMVFQVSTNGQQTETISYCETPNTFGDIQKYGNMFTSGSKQGYQCYDHSENNAYKHVIVCGHDDWSNIAGVCGYEEPRSFDGKQYSYKFVSERVSRQSALEGCKKDYGGLIKIRNHPKRNFLEARYPVVKADRWVDAEWRGILNWVTSDGEEIDDSVFHTTGKYLFNFASTNKCATTDKEWQIQPTDCSEVKPYICEIVL